MNAWIEVVRADFLERVRRPSFLALVFLSLLLGYQVITGGFLLQFGGYRGIYNAPWIGTLMAITLAFFLSLGGYYAVRGNVSLDNQTGVRQILSATPLSPVAYTFGKFSSNVMVLSVLIAVSALSALVMLLAHGEDKTLDLLQLLLPFAAFTVPVALVVAALATTFESGNFLGEGTGNVVYFLLWAILLPVFGTGLIGFDVLQRHIEPVVREAAQGYQGGVTLRWSGGAALEAGTFVWQGFEWRSLLGSRVGYVAASLVMVSLASLAVRNWGPPNRRRPFAFLRLKRKLASHENKTPEWISGPVALTPAVRGGWESFFPLMVLEFKLLTKGRPLWWTLGAVGIVVGTLTAPLEIVRTLWFPLAWVWPVVVWSELGMREVRYGTYSLIYSAPLSPRRHLGAQWSAGVLLSGLLSVGALIRSPADPTLIPGVLAAILFLPALALFLGTVTQSPRPFQVSALVIWYLGPLSGLTYLDLSSATSESLAQGMPWYYIAASFVLFIVAVLARTRNH